MLHNTHIPLKWCCIGTITGVDPEKVEGGVKDVRAQSTRKDFANYYYFIYSLKSIKFNIIVIMRMLTSVSTHRRYVTRYYQ